MSRPDWLEKDGVRDCDGNFRLIRKDSPGLILLKRGALQKRRLGTAVIYFRVSTENQKVDGISPMMQVEAGVDLADRLGLEVVALCHDNGISATQKSLHERPGSNALWNALKNDQVEAIIAFRRDRFSRQGVLDWIPFYKDLCAKEVPVHWSGGDAALSLEGDHKAILVESVYCQMAAIEGQNIQERGQAALRKLYLDGKPTGSLPLALRWENKQVVVDEVYADVIRAVYRMGCEQQNGGPQVVADLCNQLRLAGRDDWRPSDVRRIWGQKLYAGIVTCPPSLQGLPDLPTEVASDKIPKLVSLEDFRWVNMHQAGQGGLRSTRPSSRPRMPALLDEFLYCRSCGGQMKWRASSKTRSRETGAYRCSGKKHCASGPSDLVEEKVLAICAETLAQMNDEEIAENSKAFWENCHLELTQKQQRLNEQLQGLEEEFVNLMGFVKLRKAEGPSYTNQRMIAECDRLDSEIEAVREQLDQVASDIQDAQKAVAAGVEWVRTVRDWADLIRKAETLRERRLLLSQAVHRVVFERDLRAVAVEFRFSLWQLGLTRGSGTLRISKCLGPGFNVEGEHVTRVVRGALNLPFGYHQPDGVVVIDEASTVLIRKMFQMRSEGYSFREIATTIGAIAGRRQWSEGAVRCRLQNPIYCGRVTWEDRSGGGRVLSDEPSGFPAIISVEEFLNAQCE